MAQQQWFRLYTEIVGDRKLRRHDPAIRWAWVSLLCAIKQSPVRGKFYLSENVPGTFDDLADIAAVPLETIKQAIAIFKDQDMLSKDEGPLKALHWGDRQYESDSSTERTRKYRQNKKGDCDDNETSQERSGDSECDDFVAPSDPDPDPDPDKEGRRTPLPPNPIDSGVEAPKVTAGAAKSRFLAFWAVYPRKRSKGQAEKAWAKLKPDAALFAAIMAGLDRARASPDWLKEGGEFIPHPSTWLNAKGWEDEYDTGAKGGAAGVLVPMSEADQRRSAEITRQLAERLDFNKAVRK